MLDYPAVSVNNYPPINDDPLDAIERKILIDMHLSKLTLIEE